MNFQDGAPKVPPRILCIGLPVRDISVPRMLAALMVGGGLVLSRF